MDKKKKAGARLGRGTCRQNPSGCGFRRAASRTDEAGNYSRLSAGDWKIRFCKPGHKRQRNSWARKARVVAFHVLPLNVPAPALLGDWNRSREAADRERQRPYAKTADAHRASVL